jgi:hypothetical protein
MLMVSLHWLFGLILLIFGRRLFWLFVGSIGFVFGFHYAGLIHGLQADWAIFIVALFTGIIGALLAVFLQKLAIGLSGFLAGGYIAVSFLHLLGFGSDQLFQISFLVGGVIGTVLLFAVFDYALILLSSLAGASLIVQVLNFGPEVKTLFFLLMIVVGCSIQYSLVPRAKRGGKNNLE